MAAIMTVLPKLFWAGSSPRAAAKTSNSWWAAAATSRQAAGCHANSASAWNAPLADKGKHPMKMIAYLLAIICVIAAVMYFVMPAGQLPTFMPGYLAGSEHIHKTHAIAAAVAAVVLFGIGWFMGRR
jgi:hypothetical protein